jgi:hypothetical protein
MAKLVLAIGTSHGPMLVTPPEQWHLREQADRANKRHWFRGRSFDFEALAAHRAPGFAGLMTPEEKKRRHAACQRALETLAAKFREVRPDVAIILGNDQREVFKEDLTPSLLVYTGEQVEAVPMSAERRAALPPGIAVSVDAYCPPGGAVYPVAAEAARAILASLVEQGFDVACSARLPRASDRDHGIPHAFGFVYRHIMADDPPPTVPIFVNAGEPPNRPTAARCLQFGRALARALGALPGEARVAVIASGGLTHFVIDEAFDRQMLEAMQARDEDALAAIDESWLNGNTGEMRNWFPAVAAANAAGLRMMLVDYVPCYRSIAGTGNAMGFAFWQ